MFFGVFFRSLLLHCIALFYFWARVSVVFFSTFVSVTVFFVLIVMSVFVHGTVIVTQPLRELTHPFDVFYRKPTKLTPAIFLPFKRWAQLTLCALRFFSPPLFFRNVLPFFPLYRMFWMRPKHFLNVSKLSARLSTACPAKYFMYNHL